MENENDETPRISTTDMVYQAILDCREYGRAATRATIQEITGLALTTVDDRVKYLRSIGRVDLAGGNVSGVYEPTDDPMQDRIPSISYLPNGKVKVEIGNETPWLLTKREAKHIVMGLAGITLLFRG